MSGEFQGRTALVTGSSSGIGAAIARRLAAEGACIIVHGRNQGRCEQVATEVRNGGSTAYVVTGDLKIESEAHRVADFALSVPGGLDILVNNAGGESAGYGSATWMEAGSEAWISTYESNVGSVARLIRRIAPTMVSRRWGRIIQISSVAGHAPLSTIPDFGAAKAALLNLTVSLAKALAGSGVTSNSISPGLILTPSIEQWLSGMAPGRGWGAEWAVIEKKATAELFPNLVGRIGRPEEIAHAVAFVASRSAGFMTGADILIDGGQSIPAG